MSRSAFLVVLGLALPAVAQPDPLVRPLPPAAAGTEALGRYLHDLGFAPKALSPDVYQVSVARDHWAVHIMLSLSTDGRRIWMESKFAPVEDPDRVPPAAWKRLLEANEKIGPAHFAFDNKDRRIHLYKSFDNHALSVARLKAEIEHFDQTVRKTQDYWRGDNFKPVIASTDPAADPGRFLPTAKSTPKPALPALPAPPLPGFPGLPPAGEPAAADQLLGDWQIVEIEAGGQKTAADVLKARQPSLNVRPARDGDVGPSRKGKFVADLRTGPDRTRTVMVVLDATLPARHIDFVDEREEVEHGIYKLEGEILTVCFAAPGEPRPTGFTTAGDSRTWLFVLKKR
jgi:uncharacterized protein (TIGR03067 family)